MCYPENKHACLHTLTAEIGRRIEALILHLPKLENARIIEAVKRLYLDRLWVGNRVIHEPVPPKAGELLLTQAVAKAVEFTYEHHPERAASFFKRLDQYERSLKRLKLSDDELAHFPDRRRLVWHSLAWTLLGVVLFPVAAYGWLHRLVPISIVNWAIRRFAETSVNKTHVSTTVLLAGTVSFGLCYGACIALCHALIGWPISLWYGLSLPLASLVAHCYLQGAHRFATSLRSTLVLIRTPVAARRLLRLRGELIAEIEAARWEVPATALVAGGNDSK